MASITKYVQGFNYGIPTVNRPGTSYVGLLSNLESGVEYTSVFNLYSDYTDNLPNVYVSFSYSSKY